MNGLLKTFVCSLTVALAGCIAEKKDPPAPVWPGVFPAPAEKDGSAADAEPAHEGPWSWEELAVRAGARADAARIEYIAAAARRLRAEEDLAWKNPELRYGHGWDRSREHRWNRGGDSDFNDEVQRGDGYSSSVGVRFYVPNPFVNRYVRRQANAEVRKKEALAAVEAYGVYGEVKLLCLEVLRARREIENLSVQERAWDELRKAAAESRSQGVFRSPLDVVHAENRYRRTHLKRALLESSLDALRRRIAWLAGLPEEKLEIADAMPEPPEPAALSPEALSETAFARRPDLAAAVAELEAADAGVGATKAAHIPWFRFVQATYEHDSGDASQYDRSDSSHENQFELEASLIVPVFTWTGQSVKLSKLVREQADARLKALYTSIRREIVTAYGDYRDASARVRTTESVDFIKRLRRQIDDYAASTAADPEELCKVRIELADYRKLESDAELARFEAALRLESVTGGPLPR